MRKASGLDRAWARRCLTGPIPSLRTPFLRNGEIDFDGLRKSIDFNLAAGGKTVLLTAGDSHYFALSESEIAEVTRVTVAHTAGRAMVVAADRQYPTAQAVSFAKFCAETGVDMLMVLPPDWADSCDPESLAAHYAAVSEQIPVMLVTNFFRTRGAAFGLQVVERTLSAAPNVVAIKDDWCGVFGRQMALRVHERWIVFSGGQKQNHLDLHPYGCDGYLSVFLTFKPEIAWRYWAAIEGNDLAGAVEVIRDFDLPFFHAVQGLRGGFDAGIHAVLELVGLCGRWRRPPYSNLNDAEMEQLAAVLKTARIL